jgi:transcriptional regulator with XRE-family HTH domain
MRRSQVRAGLQTLGKKITQLRLQKGWNRTTLAQKAGVTITTLRGLETATKVTQPDKLRAVATALGVTVKRLETDDTSDPRVRHWTDEDYEIGTWYHHAPRQVKQRLWALQEQPASALLDPQFAPLLEGWPHLTAQQKAFVLHTLSYFRDNPHAGVGGGLVDDLAATDPKTRTPQR